jgi:hypothetical protein
MATFTVNGFSRKWREKSNGVANPALFRHGCYNHDLTEVPQLLLQRC